MNGRQAGGPGRRWPDALLGGVAGLGARVLLGGAARLLGLKSSPFAVGGVAGLVGALVGSGRVRRRLGVQPARLEPQEAIRAGPEAAAELRTVAPEPEPAMELAEEPRRGPNGRERRWHFQEGSSHTA
jgi:hypothetical protein